MPSNRDDIRDFLNRRKRVVLVEVKAADGSTPRTPAPGCWWRRIAFSARSAAASWNT